MSEEIKQINDIIERQFSGYKGNAYKKLEKLHRHMRRDIGDQRFLLFLKEQERINPRPIYKSPLITNNGKETNT